MNFEVKKEVLVFLKLLPLFRNFFQNSFFLTSQTSINVTLPYIAMTSSRFLFLYHDNRVKALCAQRCHLFIDISKTNKSFPKQSFLEVRGRVLLSRNLLFQFEKQKVCFKNELLRQKLQTLYIFKKVHFFIRC